jgi:ribose transport system permease protein
MAVDVRPQEEPVVEAEERRETRAARLKAFGWSRVTMLFVWLGVIVLFSVMLPDTFATSSNARIILSNEAISAVVALGLLLPLAAGAYDLSIGGIMSVSIAVLGTLMAKADWSPVAAAVAAVGTGALVGALNGFIVVKLKVSSFIATLGMSSILVAATYRILNGQDIVTGISPNFVKIGQNQLASIPLPVFYMLGIAIVLYYVLEHTPFGRYLYATGSNPDASRLSGIDVDRYLFISLVLSGSLSALAGVLLVAKIGTAPLDAGDPYLLPAFAAALLGSTQFRPGRVNVVGTLVAIYLLATGVKGLELKYPNNPWIDDLFQGATLIIAVALSIWASRLSAVRNLFSRSQTA